MAGGTVAPVSLRTLRQSLIDDTELGGEDFCIAFTGAADTWLAERLEEASDGNVKGMALIAVGGYGRKELCPFSDLDVLLVHKGRRGIATIADRIWYPIWDEGISLDHSVRKPNEVLSMAAEDLRVALGLLDGRVIAGDLKLGEGVIADAKERWIRQKPAWLTTLSGLVEERHRSYGDLGFLLEPDLKEAHGGLRDASALAAVMLAVPTLSDYVDTVAVADGHAALTKVRVELQRRAGRETNRLLLQDQDQIALAAGEPDGEALMRTVATAGRTIAWEVDDAWRRQRVWAASATKGRRREDASLGGVAATSDSGIGIDKTEREVVLTDEADPAGDETLSLRVAAVAAEHGLPIARDALHRLNRKAPVPVTPWSPEVRTAFVRLLAAGPPAISVIESLDRRSIFERFVPEWPAVRNRPQRNPYHRFTVDRHLLEATANAATLAHRTSRPDLLLVGTLMHDIGKGFPGDHTDVGVELVSEIGPRMGFDPDEVAVLVDMVRLHLVLPDTATRRDLDDPATSQRVADEVGNRTTLELLAILVEADSLATGPSAWGSWKAGLIATLVEQAGRRLAGEAVAPPTPWVTEELRMVMDTVRRQQVPALAIQDQVVTVIAPDRSGLLAEVTGILAIHGLNVRSALIAGEDGVAVELFTVDPERGRWPTAAALAEDLQRAMTGKLSITDELARRARTYRSERRPISPSLVSTQVTVDNHASATATVIEVRAEDSVGQLHRITRALNECQLDVASARVSTFASAVVDAFYVTTAQGGKLLDPAAIEAMSRTIDERVAMAGA